MVTTHDPVASYVKQFADMSPEAVDFIRSHMKPVFFEKHDIILRPGELCSHVYLNLKGVVRGFIKTDRRDITTWIASEVAVFTSIRAFSTRGYSDYYIQALEDCEVLAMSYEDNEMMYVLFPETNAFARKVMERAYYEAEERAFLIRLSAKEKYERFMQKHSALLNRIPLKYIASFLGIRLETLSRIRNQYAIGRVEGKEEARQSQKTS